MIRNYDNQRRFEALQKVAVELIRATDQQTLLQSIVQQATDLLTCDAGSLYLAHGEDSLAFEVAVNRTKQFDFKRILIPISSPGIACHVFNTGEPLRISNVYKIGKDLPYRFDNRVDDLIGYRTRSALAVPLVNSKGERLGVIQLINRKRHGVEPWPSQDDEQLSHMPAFSKEDETMLESLAAMASAAIEKFRLYKNIENLFDGFIHASVRAIESRDPVTSGHSERVALLTEDLAVAIDRCQDAEVRDITLSPEGLRALRYAALLHDFGKISVRENTLLKSKKLFPSEQDRIQNRLRQFQLHGEIRLVRHTLDQLHRDKRAPTDLDMAALNKRTEVLENRLKECWNLVLELNEPSILDEEKLAHLEKLANYKFTGYSGGEVPALEPSELEMLSIKRGSLSPTERKEIEFHVTSTYHFLKGIPWTPELADVPEIAHAHHEKLDGSGYPQRLKAENIPLASRMMTICDIFDALVAADRPYKKAVPVERALSILEGEVQRGQLDPRFFRVFIEAKVFDSEAFHRLNRPKAA